MYINTRDNKTFLSFVKRFHIPKTDTHKGQNGKVLIIGGSSLFHAASIWAAEIASHFADIVHYSSTKENNEIMASLKTKFRNGIVIPHSELLHYVVEDDAILLGPGMMRGGVKTNFLPIKSGRNLKFENVIEIKDEATYTYCLTKYLLDNFPEKRFVLDAGALQMLRSEWLTNLKTRPLLTPHQKEFQNFFGVDVSKLTLEKKGEVVKECAKKHNIVILLKAIIDVISDGEETIYVEGGNQGLTKGGTGDVLAGLTVSFVAKHDPILAAVLSSVFLKKTADTLYLDKGYWYNISDIIDHLPHIVKQLVTDSTL